MMEVKPVSTPLVVSSALALHDESLPCDYTQYSQLIGSLQYLQLTRPTLPLQSTNCRNSCTFPRPLIRVLPKDFCGILLGHFLLASLFDFIVCCLFMLALIGLLANTDAPTSISAYIVFLGPNLVSWSSKKQHIIAHSSIEVEYRLVVATASELQWVNPLQYELVVQSSSTPIIYFDNIGATYLCVNLVFHFHMKHLAN